MREISNQELRLADIPGDDAPDFELQEFALTFNGYAEFPDNSGRDSCAVIANSKDHRSLSRVRACLFFEQRRGRQSDIGWDRAEALKLLALIRKFGYTDLMVDGAPSPHQSDTTLRWLI
ncbi:hypothetical protein, partial [Spongiibacter tropicus]|uniref:hypothetical protein n=1 Tax=Spongiibacter tropicus TaxID=454602 RepID=UPI003A991B0F